MTALQPASPEVEHTVREEGCSNVCTSVASKLCQSFRMSDHCQCAHRFMTEQLVPASLEVEHTIQEGSRYVCVGLDALSAADELVEGVAVDLQQVIVKMKQATHTKYTPSAKFGTNKTAVLHTLIQVGSSIMKVMIHLFSHSPIALAAKLMNPCFACC